MSNYHCTYISRGLIKVLVQSWVTFDLCSLNLFKLLFQSKLFPTVHVYWKKYQAKLLEKVKGISGGVVVAGDGRHDSMGHSAKFGAYTIFCCTVPMILHFALIQVRPKIKLFVQYYGG